MPERRLEALGQARVRPWRVFWIFLQLGLTSFGGPVAHLGYFHEAFVRRRRWLAEQDYADLVALGQFLPGPASSQVGIGIGLAQAGLFGSVMAWLGFTLPSAALLTAFGYGITAWQDAVPAGFLVGLKAAATAVVAQAVWHMAQRFCRPRRYMALTLLAAGGTLAWTAPWALPAVILASGAVGLFIPRADVKAPAPARPLFAVPRPLALACLATFLALLLVLPLAARSLPSHAWDLFHSFFQSGALVFGGGHVILPLLQSTVVSPGWVTHPDFLSGYGAAQAVPGPLFTLAAYLGAVAMPEPNGWRGALLCLGAIYLPSFLLLIGIAPFWDALKRYDRAQRALAGINAAVVGILLAVLYDPIWTSAVTSAWRFLLALLNFSLLAFWRVPPWLVVILSAALGWAFAL